MTPEGGPEPTRRPTPADAIAPLAHEMSVYVSAGHLPAAAPAGTPALASAVAAEIHALVRRLHEEYWHRYSSSDPAPAGQVEESLVPLDAPDAAALMGELASVSLLWPTHTYRDREEAAELARRAVDALGPGARWWSNREDGSVSGVTGATLDTFVAGSDGERFVVLIQVQDD